MKKALALTLVLVMLLGALPAYAYTMVFYSVDDNKQYDIDALIANWIGAVQGWDTEYELDIGDLAAQPTGVIEGIGDVESPKAVGVKPLRSYILAPDGTVRTNNLIVSNEPNRISPPESAGIISSGELKDIVEGFDIMGDLLDPSNKGLDDHTIPEEELVAFSEKHKDNLTSIYTAVDYYMKAAGYTKEDYGDVDTLATALYVIVNYFPIGDRLQEYLDDPEMGTEAVFMCAEMYKGFYATFVRDEVKMAEFSYVIYMWMLNEDVTDKEGSPFALATYMPETNSWELVDVFQIALLGDTVHNDDIMNIMIDTRYFMDDDGTSSVVALRYNEFVETWQLVGMNRTAYFQLLENGVQSAEK